MIGVSLRREFDVVGTAHEAAATVATVRRLKPDAVLLDVSMSFLQAFEVATAIAAAAPATVVIFVARVENARSAELVRTGELGFLLRARDTDDITTALHELLDDAPGSELTTREAEVIQLLAQGKLMKQVADLLHVSPRTVAFHKYGVMRKLGLRSNAELVRLALAKGLVA